MKKYWLIKPENYKNINSILNSHYDDNDIRHFTLEFKKGFYATFDDEFTILRYKWGHMPYPVYKDSNNNKNKSSKKWLEKNNYIYQGEISRKQKLLKLQEKFNL